MLQLERFDIKTGKPILETIEGVQQPAVKAVEHSRLEAWIGHYNIEAKFSVARFYSGVNDADRLQLELEGKVLAFTNGQDGYFTDAKTVQLISQGGDGIEPIYVADATSAHNSVAYGSLITSDGVASTTIESARILVIDNISGDYGQQPLLDRGGNPIPATELQQLLDKMGDGTMLVQPSVMEALIMPAERDQAFARAFERAGVEADISSIGQSLQATEAATSDAEQLLRRQASQRVSQFRAATVSFPGIAKGTLRASRWAARLGVDAIISTDDIKGDDGRFSAPGLKTVDSFWVSRKTDARYASQKVGPQVKYNAPDATLREINPQGKAQAAALAEVVGDPVALSEHYVAQKDKERERPVTYDELDALSGQEPRPDWLYEVLSTDRYHQTAAMAQVVRPLNRYVRGEWLTHATHATSVPSAMAQHHSQLRSWEVCNRDLPHGAIVAYYRSPLPNVGAVTLAINNTEVIKREDPEAFYKQGVAYLPPATAKTVAITDFDGDTNGFFVGYCATVQDLPDLARQALDGQPSEDQYEAGRAWLAELMQRCDEGKESCIEPDVHPIAVREFASANAPGRRPPTVMKQAKEKHRQERDEVRSQAVWRAWEKTAENPVGKVANAGMTLQSLALELKYVPEEQKESLLIQVSVRCQSLLLRNAKGEIGIPANEWLQQQGLPEYDFKERIAKLSNVKQRISSIDDPQRRRNFIEKGLSYASSLLMDAANGPNAFNLQTAVDAAKSAKGIDENIHRFVVALQHKPDELRQHRKDHANYRDGQSLPTNTQEPIAWGVEAVNELYQSVHGQQLEEGRHSGYQSILPNAATPEQAQRRESITQTYNGFIRDAMQHKVRLSARLPKDQQPTVQVEASNGRSLVLQTISDDSGQLPIWRADGPQPDWQISIGKEETIRDPNKRFPARLQVAGQTYQMGYVSPESVVEHDLENRLKKPDQVLGIHAPSVVTQVPFAQQNDAAQLFERAERYIQSALATPPEQEPKTYRAQLASALWRHYESRHIVLKHFPEVISDRLRQVPTITLNNMNYAGVEPATLITDGPRTIQFQPSTYTDKKGQTQVQRGVCVIEPNGALKHIGTIGRESIGLPTGATYLAAFLSNPKSDLVVDMQVMELPVIEQGPTELVAFAEGRRHLTFDYEPHAAYGVREGDIVVAQAVDGGHQVALRVKDQHLMTERIVERADGQQRWASAECVPAAQLPQRFAAAQKASKSLWGLNVEPLGTYHSGQVRPFLAVEQVVEQDPAPELPLPLDAALQSLMAVSEPSPNSPQVNEIWQRYNQSAGVVAGVSSGAPGMQRRLDRALAVQAISDGYPVEDVRQAISQNSQAARQSESPEQYAQGIVEKAAPPPKAESVANSRQRLSPTQPIAHTPKKASDMGY